MSDFYPEKGTEARYGWALTFSLALHAALLFAVQVVPKGAPDIARPLTLQVKLEKAVSSEPAKAVESAPPVLEAPEDTVKLPTPVPEAKIEPPAETPRPAVKQEAPPDPPRPVVEKVETTKLLPQIEAPMVEDTSYYPAKQLDVHPTAVGAILPAYPDRAADAGVAGSITMLLLIDEQGIVRDASVVEANPEGWFEESAIAVFRNSRFSPAQRKGKRVKSRVLIRVTYELNGAPAVGGAARR